VCPNPERTGQDEDTTLDTPLLPKPPSFPKRPFQNKSLSKNEWQNKHHHRRWHLDCSSARARNKNKTGQRQSGLTTSHKETKQCHKYPKWSPLKPTTQQTSKSHSTHTKNALLRKASAHLPPTTNQRTLSNPNTSSTSLMV